jgi:hypothetical protein
VRSPVPLGSITKPSCPSAVKYHPDLLERVDERRLPLFLVVDVEGPREAEPDAERANPRGRAGPLRRPGHPPKPRLGREWEYWQGE